MRTPLFGMQGIGALLMAVMFLLACQSKHEHADLILKNGVIHTVDSNDTIAEAVAIIADRVAFVGSNQAVEKWRGPESKVIDLQGKTVVPGFIDSHYHYQGVGEREYVLNLDGAVSKEDFLDRLKTWATTRQPREWIIGRGWMEEDWPDKQFPTRTDLDAVAPDWPIFLNRADGHMALANSIALQLAGVDRNTANPAGGEILHDFNGDPNGLLVDRAMSLVAAKIPTQSVEMQEKYALKANEVALAYGVTTVHDAGSGWQTVDLWKRLYEQGKLQVRIYCFLRGPSADTDSLLASSSQIGLYDHHLTVRGIKISIDGALGSRGAALIEPYSDSETTGLFLFAEDQVYPTIKAATANGIQMAIHAIGDAANRKVLDLYERALTEVPAESRAQRDPRHRIEHAQIVHPDDLPRFKQLGVLPSMQPSHAIGDLHFAVRRLGLKRMPGAYAWRTLINDGCIIPGGSDAPVEEGNPLIEFYAAVARRDTLGFSTTGWHPELKMTRQEALRCMTLWGAYGAFEENLKGSLETGKLADMAVLDRDLMTEPEDTLYRIRNVMTIVGGKVVYEYQPSGAVGIAD